MVKGTVWKGLFLPLNESGEELDFLKETKVNWMVFKEPFFNWVGKFGLDRWNFPVLKEGRKRGFGGEKEKKPKPIGKGYSQGKNFPGFWMKAF